MYARRFLSVIAALISVGVCVFITWISKDVDLGTIAFNLTFLGIMLVMLAAAYLVGLRRLMGVTKGLRNGIDAIRNGTDADSESSRYSMFQNDFLDDCFQQYRYMSKNNPKASCDIRNFINEDAVDSYVHRGLLELVPDILTSLGILGTFVGLVMGLQEFDPSGYEQMAGSVTPLINGIKVAFITSIYGISLSLSFSFNLRSEFSNLTNLMEEFLDTYYLHVQPPYEVDSLTKLLDTQKSQEQKAQELTELFARQLQKSFEQSITPAYDLMAQKMQQYMMLVMQEQENVMTRVCDEFISMMDEKLIKDFDTISRSVASLEKSQRNYMDFMDRSIAAMQQSVQTMQRHMQESDKYTTQSLKQLTDAQKDAYRITQEQKATYQEYIRFMYQSIENFSEIWEKNSEKMQGYSDEIASMGPVISTQEMKAELNRISSTLTDLQKRQLALELSSEMDSDEKISEMLAQTLDKLDDLEELVSSPRLFRGRRSKKS